MIAVSPLSGGTTGDRIQVFRIECAVAQPFEFALAYAACPVATCGLPFCRERLRI